MKSLARTFATLLVFLFVLNGQIAVAQTLPPPHAVATAIEDEMTRCQSDSCIDWHQRAYKLLIDIASELRRMELTREDILSLPDNADQLAQVDQLITTFQNQQAKIIGTLSDPMRPK